MRRRPIFASSKTGSETTINEGKYEFKLAWGLVPHPDKAWKGGEDAIYVSSNLLAVADGVGGWSSLGVDAGVYSRQLINIIRELHQNSKDDYYIEHPDKIAIQAVQRNEEKGSATLAILTLHPRTGTLRCYHIGDSIFGLFKRGTEPIVAAEQQTQFNVPYQVHSGKLNALDGSLTLSGQSGPSDVFRGSYNQFSFNQIQDRHIILASDGLWDNLHVHQIQQQLWRTQLDLKQKTKNLIHRIHKYTKGGEYESPFYQKALQQGLQVPKCGKIDDISLIIAQVTRTTL